MKYNISTNFHTLNHWQSCKKRKKKPTGWPKYSDWGKNGIKYGYNESAKFYPKYGYIEKPKSYPKYGYNENAKFYVKFGVIE